MQFFNSTLYKIALPLVAMFLLVLCMAFVFNASNNIVAAQDAGEGPSKIDLQFQMLEQRTLPGTLYRSKVPGGWIVAMTPLNDRQSVEMVFVPDPEHSWDGKSLE